MGGIATSPWRPRGRTEYTQLRGFSFWWWVFVWARFFFWGGRGHSLNCPPSLRIGISKCSAIVHPCVQPALVSCCVQILALGIAQDTEHPWFDLLNAPQPPGVVLRHATFHPRVYIPTPMPVVVPRRVQILRPLPMAADGVATRGSRRDNPRCLCLCCRSCLAETQPAPALAVVVFLCVHALFHITAGDDDGTFRELRRWRKKARQLCVKLGQQAKEMVRTSSTGPRL